MDKSSMQLTVFLFHIETCCSFVFSLASIIICLFGFYRTRLWGFILMAISTFGFAIQLGLHYYYFLRAYELPPALKISGTTLFFLSSILGLAGVSALAFAARRHYKPSNQALEPTASRSDA
jgi:fatty-acid desaturase